MYKYRLDRYRYIYKYIEQALDQNLEISNIFHLNHRLPEIIKKLKMGDNDHHCKAIIYLSPDEVIKELSEEEEIDFEVTPTLK